MKKLFMLGLMLIFILGVTSNNIASGQNNVEKLIGVIKSGEEMGMKRYCTFMKIPVNIIILKPLIKNILLL